MHRHAVGMMATLVVCMMVVSGCGGGSTPGVGGDSAAAIRHAATDGIDHFYFLRPLAPDPTPTGDFDGSRVDDLRVDVYLMTEGDDPQPDGLPVASFRSTGGATESENIRLDPEDEAYLVGFHTNSIDLLEGRIYRIFVYRGSDNAEYGFADAQIFANMKEAKSLQDDTVFPLKDGRTLQIRFRIEVGAEPVLPGQYKIAFYSYRDGNAEIYVMNEDGSDQTRLTSHSAEDRYPSWSPDGSKIAFASNRSGDWEIYTMHPDGTDVQNVSQSYYSDELDCDWSPDGARIVYGSRPEGSGTTARHVEIWVMDSDGSDKQQLTDDGGNPDVWSVYPSWSPDGTTIAYAVESNAGKDVWTMAPNGQNQAPVPNISQPTIREWRAKWSPDGSQFAVSIGDNATYYDIYTCSTDGSGLTQVTDSPGLDSNVAWHPLGTRLAITRIEATGDIYVMDVDGANVQQLTDDPSHDLWPDFSPVPLS